MDREREERKSRGEGEERRGEEKRERDRKRVERERRGEVKLINSGIKKKLLVTATLEKPLHG